MAPEGGNRLLATTTLTRMSMSDSPILFDRSLLRARLRRAAALGPATFLLDRVAEDFADRLAPVLRQFARALDLGTPTDALRRALMPGGKIDRLIAATPIAGPAAAEWNVVADAEVLPFADGTLDLVVSGL